MFRKLTLAAALLAAAPALAAPIITANVSHNCCPQCDRAIVRTGTKLTWVSEFKTDRQALSVTMKPQPTGRIDLIEAVSAFRQGGFPLQGLKVEGARSLEFNAGHLCCNGCAGPLREALSSVKGLTGVRVAPNQPVRANIQGTLDVSALLKTLDEAGYSATTLVVQ